MLRTNTPPSPAWACIRIRSPRIAPPLKGLVGSTASTPTVRPSSRQTAVKRSARVLLPTPGAPVSPTTRACPVLGKSAPTSAADSGASRSTVEMARATARRSPATTAAANSAVPARPARGAAGGEGDPAAFVTRGGAVRLRAAESRSYPRPIVTCGATVCSANSRIGWRPICAASVARKSIGSRQPPAYARMPSTTAPWTSVRRKSRPWHSYVSLVS